MMIDIIIYMIHYTILRMYMHIILNLFTGFEIVPYKQTSFGNLTHEVLIEKFFGLI